MPRGILDLGNPADLEQVNGVWKFAPGLVPGEPNEGLVAQLEGCLLYTSPSPRDLSTSRMPSSA